MRAAPFLLLPLAAIAVGCGTQSCKPLDRVPFIRQDPPAPGDTAAYCNPDTARFVRQHPGSNVNPCVTFQLSDAPVNTTLPTGGWLAPFGVFVSNDDQSVTIVWMGFPQDVGVIVEETNDVRVGYTPFSKNFPLHNTYVGATRRLNRPLGSRPVKVIALTPCR